MSFEEMENGEFRGIARNMNIKTVPAYRNRNNSNNGDDEQGNKQKSSDARGRWRDASGRGGEGRETPRVERVIDTLREKQERSDWDDYDWRHVEDRRGAMGHIYTEKPSGSGSQCANKYQTTDPFLPASSSRHSLSVSHQPESVQYPPKLPPIETNNDTTISEKVLRSMMKYHMNVGKLLHKKVSPQKTSDRQPGHQEVGKSPASSIESIGLLRERSSSHRCAKTGHPTPHVDEFGPPPPRDSHAWSGSKHSIHKRWNKAGHEETHLAKFSHISSGSGGSLPAHMTQSDGKSEVREAGHRPEHIQPQSRLFPRLMTRDRGVQVSLVLGSPLRTASNYSQLDQGSTPSIITQVYTGDTKMRPGNTLDVKKPSLYSTQTAASSILTSVPRHKTHSVLSMRPTLSVGHYIYNMKHKEADKRSITNVVQNLFDFGSERSSAPLMNTVIGEVSDSSQDSLDGEYRIARQKVDKNPRAGMNCLRLLLHDMKTWWRRLKRRQEENPIFSQKIKAIEGHFGSGIVSFFVFLRWLVCLNALFACLWLLFIVFPQLGAPVSNTNNTFYTIDIFTGKGALEDSILFYGSYTETVGVYPLALLYFLSIILTFFGGFFIVLRSLAWAIEDEGINLKGSPYTFLALVFSAWDYSLTSPEAATNLAHGITNTFREVIRELEVRKVLESQSKKEKVDLYGRRALAWIVTFFCLTLGVTVIFLVVSSDLETLLTKWGYKVTSESFVILYGPVIIFIFINVTVPEFIYKLPVLERYSRGREEIHITIARVFVLRMFNVLALLVSLIQRVKQFCQYWKGDIDFYHYVAARRFQGDMYSEDVQASHQRHLTRYEGCAGTLIAQELYKLVIIDTVLGIFTAMVPHYVKFYWFGEKQEFDMPPQVLKVIYRQAVVWLGTLVSPLMPVVGVLSGVIFFVSNHVMVMHTCKPPEKRWNQPRRSTFFMVLTAVTLLVLIILVSIIIGRSDFVLLGEMGSDPSHYCGPFRNQTMTTVFLSWQEDMKVAHPSVGQGLEFVLSGTVLMPAVLVMLALLYFQKLRIGWEKKHSCQLFADLEQERSTNMELLKKIHQNGPFG